VVRWVLLRQEANKIRASQFQAPKFPSAFASHAFVHSLLFVLLPLGRRGVLLRVVSGYSLRRG
jgi:hypothetical protein